MNLIAQSENLDPRHLTFARPSAILGRFVGPMGSGYGLALFFVASAVVSSILLQRFFSYPFLFLFFAAVMAGAWFGGTGPGLFAVLLSTLTVDYFFVPPFHSLAINATDGTYFAAFVVCALVASWVSAAKKANEQALVKARDQLAIHVTERTAELAKSIEQSTFDIAVLSKMASRLSAADPLHQVLNEVVEFVGAIVECDSCMVYAMEGDDLVLRASKNPHPEAIDCLKMRVGQGITGWVAEHRTPVAVTQSAYNDPRFKLFNELPEDRFEAFLSVPLVSGGHLVGVINLQSRTPHQYSEREIGLVSAIGFLVGAEVERARLETEKSELSDRLETRKLVERAKGILQRELKINEAEAYRLLQRESQQHRKSMRDLSESIIWQDDLKRGSCS